MPDLLDGIEVTTVAVALFAIGETLYVAATARRGEAETVEPVRGSLWMTLARLAALLAPPGCGGR